ncbi:TPA: hypothetical protein ACNTWY_005109, partial [Escherichia coli]
SIKLLSKTIICIALAASRESLAKNCAITFGNIDSKTGFIDCKSIIFGCKNAFSETVDYCWCS